MSIMTTPSDVMLIEDDSGEEEVRAGLRNIISAEEYAVGLDKTVQHLKDSLHEDQKDTLLMMINGLKRRMAVQFKQMRPADAEVVLHMIKDMRCLALMEIT